MNAMNNEKGFSLIEALVATAILSIGIITLITMQTTSVKGNAKARGLTTAASWGQDKLEEFVNTDYGDIVNGSEPSPDTFYSIAWTVDDNVLASVPKDPITNETYLKQIQVTVSRNDFGSQRDITFNHFKQNN